MMTGRWRENPRRNHSSSFDQRRRPETFLTAIATAFFWPTRAFWRDSRRCSGRLKSADDPPRRHARRLGTGADAVLKNQSAEAEVFG